MLLFIDGFEMYGTPGNVSPVGCFARRWTLLGSAMPALVANRNGSAVSFISGSGLRRDGLGFNQDPTTGVGCLLRAVSGHADGTVLFQLYDGATAGVGVTWGTDGELNVVCGSTVLGTTSGLGANTSTWYFIELKVLCGSGTDGQYILRVNGVDVLHDAACNTQAGSNPYYSALVFPANTGTVKDVDDLYIFDGYLYYDWSVNDLLGIVQVTRLDPIADVDTSEGGPSFTPSEGTALYALIDDGATADDDATYVEAVDPNAWNLYDFPVVGHDTMNAIYGVQACMEVKGTPTDLQLCHLMTDGCEPNQPYVLPISGWCHLLDVMEADASYNAWTLDSFSLATFGIGLYAPSWDGGGGGG